MKFLDHQVDITDAAREYLREWTRVMQETLVKAITTIEGRAPSLEEVQEHGTCMCHPDGSMQFRWKGEAILDIAPAPRPGETFSLPIVVTERPA